MAESLENSRTNRCVNLMGLSFLEIFFSPYEIKFKMNACFFKFFSFTFVKIVQYFRPRPLE